MLLTIIYVHPKINLFTFFIYAKINMMIAVM